jgi:hypothetical protein
MQRRLLALALLVAACGSDRNPMPGTDGGGTSGPPKWTALAGDRLGPLPAAAPGQSTRFITSEQCAQCHTAQAPSVLSDAKGRDVSPYGTWRGTMMAHAARDPYYLAQFSGELVTRPAARDTVETTCTVCHEPAAAKDLEVDAMHVGFTGLTTVTSPDMNLARDGVTCSLCHQIQEQGLGTPQSFDAKYVVGPDRRIFGPHMNPLQTPMQMFVGYTPVEAKHVTESKLCSTCHTVITKPLDAQGKPAGADFVEQAPYLEWLNSDFRTEGTPGPKQASCQGCHMPTQDDDGAAITTVLSKRPLSGLSPRSPIGRHLFLGANSQLLSVLADDPTQAGTLVPADELRGHAARAEANLRAAAKVDIVRATRSGDTAQIDVRVENRSGHKFPTGYPSRRAWLHVRVLDGTRVVFESGRVDAWGRIVSGTGAPLDGIDMVRNHRDVVSSDTEVQVWESVPGTAQGKVARSLFDAVRYLKDDRLLPAGYSKAYAYAPLTDPIGAESDPNFGSSDVVTFRVAGAPAKARVEVELLFQSVRPGELDGLAERPTPAGLAFLDRIAKRMAPTVVGTAATEVP